MAAAFQLSADIAAVAGQGAALASSDGLRSMSAKIHDEMVDNAAKLNKLYGKWHCGCTLTADMQKAQALACAHNVMGCPFDQTLANTLITLLEQEKCAADLAAIRAGDPDLRKLAKQISNADQNEIDYLQRWQAEHQMLVPIQPVCAPCPTAPATSGAGPQVPAIVPMVPAPPPAVQMTIPQAPAAPSVAPMNVPKAPSGTMPMK